MLFVKAALLDGHSILLAEKKFECQINITFRGSVYLSVHFSYSGSLQRHKALLQKGWLKGDRQKDVYILRGLGATQGNKADLGVGFCDGGGHV